MRNGKTIGVVVPAYNESGLVGDVIRSIPEFVDRVYVVDDCSTDGTWDEIRAAARDVNERTTPPDQGRLHADGGRSALGAVVPIRHDRNRGVGAAIKTGYRRAHDEAIDVTAVVSGDGQMDPGILDRIVDPVVEGHADYVKGNRLSRSDYREEMSAWRLFGNVVLTLMTKVVSGYWRISDPQNGYTAISSRALDAIDVEDLYDDYGFANDLLVALNVHGMRVVDVDMKAKYGEEESHIRYSRFVPKLSTLLARRGLWRLKVKYLVTEFHPLVFLYILGSVGIAGGLLYGGWSVLASTASPLDGVLSLLTVLFSSVAITLGMIFDRIDNAPLEAHGGQRRPNSTSQAQEGVDERSSTSSRSASPPENANQMGDLD
jgi:glycosyltransferase involved in cell wall biosynthesis